MNFTAKVLAIISGATLTAYMGNKLALPNKLRNTFPMERQTPEGTFTFVGNKSCNLRGKDYYGRIIRNINSDIKCEDTSVELLDNRNLKADLTRSTVTAIDESNSSVSAISSTVEMRSNRNIQVDVNDSWCDFESNRNLSFKGQGGFNVFLSKFVGNQNSKFTGKNNRIVAFNNKNMLIEDDNNHLEITATRNHNVRPAPSGSTGNTFTVRSSSSDTVQFVVEYVDTAVINGPKYQLGWIEFVAVTSSNRVNVTLNEAEDVIYSVSDFASDKIVIQAERNGITQTLELKGERVDAAKLNSYNIFVNE